MSDNKLIEKLRDGLQPTGKRTYIAFVLDGSGSMELGKNITIEGYNKQVDIVKENAGDGGDTRVTLVTFNNYVRTNYSAQPASALEKLTAQSYTTTGGTALYDAIGAAISQLEEAPGIDSPDTAVLIAVFTDGEENSSKTWNAADLRKKVSALTETNRWTFTLIGPKSGLGSLAELLAIDKGNVAGFDPGSLSSRTSAFAQLSGATASYMSLRSSGMTSSASLYANSDQPDK